MSFLRSLPAALRLLFLPLLVAAVASSAEPPPNPNTGPWEGFGNGPEHTGSYPATLKRNVFTKAWEQDFSRVSTVLERPVIGNGMVFMTHMRIYTQLSGEYGQMVAMDLKTGSFPWYNPYGLGRKITPPCFHNGRLYFATNVNFRNDSRIYCLDATTGAQQWMTKFDDTGRWYEAPTATDAGVLLAGSFRGGMHFYDQTGVERWFKALPDQTGWTPAVSGSRIFTSLAGSFTEHSPVDGSNLWSIDTPQSSMSIPVISGDRALVKKGSSIVCIDLATRTIAWTVENAINPGSHPAVSNGVVYALQGNTVRSFALADGAPGKTFTAAAPQALISEQPLLLNELLIAANPTSIFVFDLKSGEQIQSLPGGGKMCFADGYLVSVGTDVIIRCYKTNAPPEFTGVPVPEQIIAEASAPDLHLDLGASVMDPDPGDTLHWTIKSIENPAIFRSLEIDAETGALDVKYNPWQEGASYVTVEVTDPEGGSLEFDILFVLPSHSRPELEFTETFHLNRQTGLYEQTITVTNTSAREIAGFDLTITGLPFFVWVYNGNYQDGGSQVGSMYLVRSRQPLAPGETRTMVIEYLSYFRNLTFFSPTATLELAFDVEPPAPGGLADLEVDRCEVLPDKSLLIEFTAIPGRLYEIEYSDDATTWHVSPMQIRAGANRVQWIDRGPPRTHTPPSATKSRFYRVRQLSPY